MAFDLSRRKKIAVTGIANSGKTVFLTSLLWQLHEFEGADFGLENGVRVAGFRKIRSESTFPFDKFQDAMAKQGEWPRKTKDIHQFVGEFKRSDRLRKQQVEFLDFPGERIADAAIAGYDDFGDWSDHMLDHFESDSGYRRAAHVFQQEMEGILSDPQNRFWRGSEKFEHQFQQGLKGIGHQMRKGLANVLSRRQGGDDLLRNQIVRGYRRVLARYALDCKPLISPPCSCWIAMVMPPDPLSRMNWRRNDCVAWMRRVSLRRCRDTYERRIPSWYERWGCTTSVIEMNWSDHFLGTWRTAKA